MANAPQGLFKLPNELLREIATFLGPAYLRRLSQVNHRLLDFALDHSRPHVSRLAALPDDVVLRIAASLDDRGQSRLARTSHRFYSLIMDLILREEVRLVKTRLMALAVGKGRLGLARRLLQRGADANASIYLQPGLTRDHTRGQVGYKCGRYMCWRPPLSVATHHRNVEMVKLLLHFGADVHASFSKNHTCGCLIESTRFSTSLLVAVYYGYEDLVKLLLQAGASPIFRDYSCFQDNVCILSSAISKRHEHIVLLLLQALDATNELGEPVIKDLFKMASKKDFRSLSTEVLREHEHVILRRLPPVESIEEHPERDIAAIMELAVAGKLVKIVEYLAQLRTKLHMKQAISLDSALYNIISYDTCIGEIRKRELHQEVYQIVDILLAQGANPDAFEHMGSARDLASTHPDPRVKNRFLHAARPKQHSKELSSQVGRSWVTPSQALPTRTPKRAKRLRQAPRVNLWDYVKSHNGQEQSGNQESDVAAVLESNDNGTGGGQVTSVSTSASTNAVDASGDHAGLQPDLPSPLASSSPHDGSKVPEVLPPKRVWGEVRSATTPATAQAKTSQDDEFPVLLWKCQTDTADMNSSSKASTSLKGKADAEASDTKQTQKSGKSLKGKKKWEKLVLS